jgi:hypothetical protein
MQLVGHTYRPEALSSHPMGAVEEKEKNDTGADR